MVVTMMTGDRLTMNSLKVRPLPDPIMMLGGSPMRVAVPPILEKMAMRIRMGAVGAPRSWVMRMVMGAMRMTVVTLSRKAETKAVTKRTGGLIWVLPWAFWAMVMASHLESRFRQECS